MKIPKAEEYLKSRGLGMIAVHSVEGTVTITDVMKEFAKMHLQKAKKAIVKKGEITHNGYDYVIDEESLERAYPETLIT